MNNISRLDLWKNLSTEELEELVHGLGWSQEEDCEINVDVNRRLIKEIKEELERRKI